MACGPVISSHFISFHRCEAGLYAPEKPADVARDRQKALRIAQKMGLKRGDLGARDRLRG